MISSREDLALYFRELGFRTGAEIGVFEGDYSKLLCIANPALKLYCVDSWGIDEKKHFDLHTRAHRRAKRALAPFNTILIHKKSMAAVKDFDDGELDFVYIDANHRYQHVKEDIAEWSKKVRQGGIVSGHDYLAKIKEAVDEHVKDNGLDLHVTAIKSDNALSWWFIQQ